MDATDRMKTYETDGHIELVDGSKFKPDGSNATGFIWNVDTIAHALGQQARYTGHAKFRYSVAEHSVLVSLLSDHLNIGDPFEALMHDAHESVMGDLAKPWKSFVAGWSEAEKMASDSLRSAFGLPLEESPEVKQLDMTALFIEAYFLMKSRGEGWVDPLNLRPRALELIQRDGFRIQGLNEKDAKNVFLARYAQVAPQPLQWWAQQDQDEGWIERDLEQRAKYDGLLDERG